MSEPDELPETASPTSLPPITLTPIAVVRSPRKAIEDDDWGEVVSQLELLPPLTEEALLGLETFSHVEVLYFFDQVPITRIETGARHPRNNPDWPKVGIFAQRGKNRPNRLGSTVVKVLARRGSVLEVQGLDAIDGTPVVDLKPVMQEFLPREAVSQPAWSSELMRGYWTLNKQ